MCSKLSIFLGMLLTSILVAVEPSPIKHRFIAIESHSAERLHFIDESKDSDNWTFALSSRARDIQLIGKGCLMVSTVVGYDEINLTTRQRVKTVKGYQNIESARRLVDGRTILSSRKEIIELDGKDAVLRRIKHDAGFTDGLLIRQTPISPPSGPATGSCSGLHIEF